MPDYTTEQTGAQDGSSIAGVWFDGQISLVPGNGFDGWVGLVFDFQRTAEAERGLLLEPPLVNGLSLSLVNFSGAAGTAEILVWYVPEFEPDDYSTALLPSTRSELQLSTTGAGVVVGDPTVLEVLSATAPTTNQQQLRSQLLSGRWRGKLALSIQVIGASQALSWAAAENLTQTAPTLTSAESSFHTGQHNIAHGRRARVRHDPKDGLPYLSDEYVRDGYVEGMMVHPDNWDPVDPPDPHTPANEGVVRDEVT